MWIHSLVQLILKFLEIQPGPSGLCLLFFFPGYQQFFEIENTARSESPSSVSQENNCMKTEINRGQ